MDIGNTIETKVAGVSEVDPATFDLEVALDQKFQSELTHLKYALGETTEKLAIGKETTPHTLETSCVYKEMRGEVIGLFVKSILLQIFQNELRIEHPAKSPTAEELEHAALQAQNEVSGRYQKIADGSHCYSRTDITGEILHAFHNRRFTISAFAHA